MKPKEGSFRMDIKRKVSPRGWLDTGKRLPRELGTAASLTELRRLLDRALGHTGCDSWGVCDSMINYLSYILLKIVKYQSFFQ